MANNHSEIENPQSNRPQHVQNVRKVIEADWIVVIRVHADIASPNDLVDPRGLKSSAAEPTVRCGEVLTWAEAVLPEHECPVHVEQDYWERIEEAH